LCFAPSSLGVGYLPPLQSTVSSNRRNEDTGTPAFAQRGAGLWFPVFSEAEFHFAEIAAPAAKGDLRFIHAGIRLGDGALQVGDSNDGLAVRVLQLRRYAEAREDAAHKLEVIVGVEAAAGAVSDPFMLDERGRRHNVEQAVWIRRSRLISAVLGTRAGSVVLWPEAMDDKTQMLVAFGAARMAVTEFGRPREAEQIVIEPSRLLTLGWVGKEQDQG